MSEAVATTLVPGRVYSWEEIGSAFDFNPDYLSVAGGMVSRHALDRAVAGRSAEFAVASPRQRAR